MPLYKPLQLPVSRDAFQGNHNTRPDRTAVSACGNVLVLVYGGAGVVVLADTLSRSGRRGAILSRILVNAFVVELCSLLVSLLQPNAPGRPGPRVFWVTNRCKFIKAIPARLADCLRHTSHKHDKMLSISAWKTCK